MSEKMSEKMKKILQINFRFNAPRSELEEFLLQGAQPIADVKGLLWKVWILNEAEKSTGGIYLFEDDASVQAFLKGMMAMQKNNPDFEAKVFDILPEHTKIARGPVD